MDVGEVIAKFLEEWITARGLAPKTHDTYRQQAQTFFGPYMAQNVEIISHELLIHRLQELEKLRKWSYNTKGRYHSLLKCIGRWLHEEGIVQRNPAWRIKAMQPKRSLAPTIAPRDVHDMIALLDIHKPWEHRTRVAILAAYYAMLRIEEMRALKLNDFMSASGPGLYVRNPIKRERSRTNPIPPYVAMEIQHFLDVTRPTLVYDAKDSGWLFPGTGGKQMSKTVFEETVSALASRAEIPFHVTPHTLRHSIADLLANPEDYGMDWERVSLEQLQKFLGHKSISATMHYVHGKDTTAEKAYRQRITEAII